MEGSPPPDGVLPISESTDIAEFLYGLGVSDGFPLVPPTKAKLRWMLAATDRDPAERIGQVAPSLSTLTVQLAATNALMAGCTPSQLPLVLAGAEAMLSDDFNLHGVHATTMGATVAVIVNGPARKEAGINSGMGVLGSGTRTNACVGRALKLILQNVGAAKLGGTESSTISNPSKFGVCMAEREELLGPWEPLATSLSLDNHAGQSWVTVQAVSSGPEQLVDFDTQDAEVLIEKLASKASQAWGAHFPMVNETLMVISPEHAKTLQEGGYQSKAQLQKALFHSTNALYASMVHKAIYSAVLLSGLPTVLKSPLGELVGLIVSLIMNGLNILAPCKPRSFLMTLVFAITFYKALHAVLHVSSTAALALVLVLCCGQRLLSPLARAIQAKIPKFSSPESFHIVLAGADAGKFSSFLPGFGMGRPPMPVAFMSRAVTRRVLPPLPTPEVPPAEPIRELMDPRCASGGLAVIRAARPVALKGTVGLLDISKHGGSILLERFESQLKGRLNCRRYCKPTFSRPCPDALRKKIAAECDYLIEALAD